MSNIEAIIQISNPIDIVVYSCILNLATANIPKQYAMEGMV